MLNRFIQALYLLGVLGSGFVIIGIFYVILIEGKQPRSDDYIPILLFAVGPIFTGWIIKFIVTGDKSWKPRLGDVEN